MAKVVCVDCGRDNFRSVSGLAKHRAAKHPPKVEGAVLAATDAAVEAARAAGQLGDVHQAVVAVLRELAKTIDGMPQRDPDAPLDNVTVPTFLKYADALGLTPLAQSRIGGDKKPEAPRGKLAVLQGAAQARRKAG